MTNEENFKNMAAQLRKPDGADALNTADMMSKGNKSIIFDTFEALNSQAGDNILEIGMGNGFYVKEILAKADNILYTGCDYSEAMVTESVKLNADSVSGKQARFIHSDIRRLPFADETFNKVFTINTIYFWDDEVMALNEIKRVLMPDGKLIIGFRPKHQTEKYPFTKYGFNQFSKKDVEALITNNGFYIIDIFENKEQPFELNGLIMETENVIVVASKLVHK